MFNSKVHIEAGDVVIVYMTRDNMLGLTITPGEVLHNKYGRYPHDNMMGMKFGSKMHSPHPHPGYIHLLRPTPELWTLSLPHRTQILYNPDISYISMRLGARPGARVVEAGTGSGSMTHALSRSTGRRGKVFSFEYHQPRFEKAKAEFEDHKLDNVELRHRNVCKDGFEGASDVDAVFLDLPAPWEAISHAVKVLRSDRMTRICCFSPCLEQVLKTVSTLRAEGFEDVSTQEVLVRTHDLIPAPPATSSHLHDISSIIGRMREHETRKAERRILQMKTAREKAAKLKEKQVARTAQEDIGETEMVEDGDDTIASRKRPAEDDEPLASKRIKCELDGSVRPAVEDAPDALVETTITETTGIERERVEKTPLSIWSEPPAAGLLSAVLTKPSAEMRGHTSYLTFACFYPSVVRQQISSQGVAFVSNGKPTLVPTRVQALRKDAAMEPSRAGSEETEYGDDAMDVAMGTMTEEEIMGASNEKRS